MIISGIVYYQKNGGEKGIRTLGTLSRTHAFQACSFNQLRHLSKQPNSIIS